MCCRSPKKPVFMSRTLYCLPGRIDSFSIAAGRRSRLRYGRRFPDSPIDHAPRPSNGKHTGALPLRKPSRRTVRIERLPRRNTEPIHPQLAAQRNARCDSHVASKSVAGRDRSCRQIPVTRKATRASELCLAKIAIKAFQSGSEPASQSNAPAALVRGFEAELEHMTSFLGKHPFDNLFYIRFGRFAGWHLDAAPGQIGTFAPSLDFDHQTIDIRQSEFFCQLLHRRPGQLSGWMMTTQTPALLCSDRVGRCHGRNQT